MMYGTVRIVHNNTKLLRGECKRRGSQIVRKTALDVLGRMQSIVIATAFDTGNLANSLAPGGPDNISEMEPGGLVATVGTAVDYGPYVNYGTVVMAARPFAEPAAEAYRPVFNAAFTHLLGPKS